MRICQAVVLEKGGEWATLMSADLFVIEPETVSNVRKRLSAAGVGTGAFVYKLHPYA